ncbi:tRNA-dihydrouridine(47) synthase [NAD(P)(+)]-like [Elgaria multicarinata webbii]|uniref:tRNA-dihydrouridine(47) synthase [NAD(P)(+)]-like n=1 Tax=Elgaria multicarinata webbii TaxID=159646 RepID=UPI002FCCC4F7
MEAAGLFPNRDQNISVEERFPSHPGPNEEMSSNQDNNENGAQGDNFEDPSQLWKVPNPEKDGTQGIHLQNMNKDSRRSRKNWETWLCRSVARERPELCAYGSQCLYKHDIQEFLAMKPPDLGDRCVAFETFGKCPSGVACRFSKAHLGEDYKNLVNVDLWKQWEGKQVKNRLSEELFKKVQTTKFSLDRFVEYMLAAPMSRCAEGPGGHASADTTAVRTSGTVTDEDIVRLRPCEKRKLDFRDKLYLSPLEKFSKIPFRRICKQFGADITCTEKLMCDHLINGKMPPWTRLERHHTEDVFGVQLIDTAPTDMIRCAELIQQTVEVDFMEVCVDNTSHMLHNEGEGSKELDHNFRWKLEGMNYVLDVPLALKMCTGNSQRLLPQQIIPSLRDCGVSLVTLYGQTKLKKNKKKSVDLGYIADCARIASPMPLFGNRDIYSFEDFNLAMASGVSGVLITREALIKPWIFTEIKEQRHWDISARERLEMLNDFIKHSLEFWGSDDANVERIRQSLLEWLSYLCRYVPVGTVEHLPPNINDKPGPYVYGDYLENLMASQEKEDWIKISNMFLGPRPE